MRVTVLAVILGSIAGAAVLARQDPFQQPNVPLAPGRAIIAGRVVEAGTARGVANAVVTLGSASLGSSAMVFANGTLGGSRRAAADENGRFAFRDLPTGRYWLIAAASGFLSNGYGQTRASQEPDGSRQIEVSDADRPLTLTLQLWRTAGLGGLVRDEHGDPIAGLPVAIISRSSGWDGIRIKREVNLVTDDRGMYHADVAPGDYQVAFLGALTTVPVAAVDGFQQARMDGGAAMSAFMQQVETSGGVLPRGYGSRIGTLVVTHLDEVNRPVLPPFTDANGRWMFYPTTFAPIVSLASGDERAGVNLDLRPIPIRRVTGRITGPDGPATGLAVRLVSADPSVRPSNESRLESYQALTDAAGAFAFLGVAPGAYTIYAFRRMGSESSQLQWASDALAMADADVTGVELRLQPGTIVSGRVVFDGVSAPPSTEGRQIHVVAGPMPGSIGALIGGRIAGTVDGAGRFAAGPLVPGPHVLLVSELPVGWTVKSATSGGKDIYNPPFIVSGAGASDLVVTLTDKFIDLAGMVRTAGGDVSTTSTVVIFPVNRLLWPEAGIVESPRVRIVTPDQYGRYAFHGLLAGEYALAAVESPRSDFMNPQLLEMLMPAATRITLADGDSRSQDLRATVVR